MAIDIFAPQISVVSKDLSGKTIMVYGTNRTGKTYQATHFPKPYYWAFEAGLGAMPGIPFQPIRRWSDYTSMVKQFTNEKNIDRAKEMYQTIILDQAEAMGLLCEQYVCMKFGVTSLGEQRTLPNGKQDYSFNGFKEYSKEFEYNLRLLTSVGFTIVFIAHEGTREFKDENGEAYTKIYPKGDKRIIDPICDLVDIIAYASVNGLDENGQEIPSSLFLRQTRKYHAGSRFTYLAPVLKEFTAENLTQAIMEAVTQEEANSGFKAVTYTEQAATQKVADLPPYEEIKKKISEIAMAVYNIDEGHTHYGAVQVIVERHLGKGKSITNDTTPDQVELLCVIYDDLRMFIEDDPDLCKILQTVDNQ